MFCSDTLTVQQLSLRTSRCYFHLSFRFLPPRDTHTIISMDYCPMAIIHIPVHTVWAQTPHPDVPSGLQNSPHLWQLHPESSHHLTGPARVSVFDYFLAKGKGHQRLDLLISPALGICAHGIWQPKRAMYQTSTCSAMEPNQNTPEVLCPAYIIFLDITHAVIYWRIPPSLTSFQVIRGHQDLDTAHRTEHTTLDAIFLGSCEEVGR